MKRIILISLFLILCQLSNSQDIYKLNITENKYFVDTLQFSFIVYSYNNTSKENIYLWFEEKDVSLYTDEHLIKMYFFKTKGDFSLIQIINENITNDIHSVLYKSFIKKIVVGNSFDVITKRGNENEINDSMKKHIVIIKESDLVKMVDIKKVESIFYQGNNIVLLPDIL